jgi:hypothetical protein
MLPHVDFDVYHHYPLFVCWLKGLSCFQMLFTHATPTRCPLGSSTKSFFLVYTHSISYLADVNKLMEVYVPVGLHGGGLNATD